MARVIVILALMLVITGAMFALTRNAPVAPGVAATEPRTTVPLTARADDDKIDDAGSVTSIGPRLSAIANPQKDAPAEPATPASAQDVADGPVAGAAPSFGTAGIDQKGNASFTGTATPGDTVSLVMNGQPLGTTKADDKGNWSLGFKAPAGDAQLLVSAQGDDGSVVIGPQRAFIKPPATAGGLPNIALKAADRTETLQEGNAAPADAKVGLVVEKVSGGDDGVATLNGRADAGATVKVSINRKPAGETRVAADGNWTLTVTNTGKSADTLRLELIDREGATLDQADVPYKVASASAKVAAVERKSTTKPIRKSMRPKDEGAKKLAAVTEPAATANIEADSAKPKVIKVRRGDSLWRIARRHLGKGKKWAAFYKANKDKIDNPDLIYPGQVLILPG